MTTIYLVRHGETVWNADGRIQGQLNSPLSELGRTQAKAVALAMAAHHLDAIYTSDLDRAADTARAIAAHHTTAPVPDTRLREAGFGEWEGHTMDEVAERWPNELADWRADALRHRPPGGETLEDVQRRVAEVVSEVVKKYPDGRVALVGHGGSLRAAVAIALGAEPSIFRHLRLDNCSITTIQHRDDGYTLVHLNDLCHLHRRHAHSHGLDESGDQWRVALKGQG